jgi:two-component system, sensor histidine kinase and response regulator
MNTILVIDDDQAVLASLQGLLALAGFRVITAANGAAGVHLAMTHHPNLILCDVQMPTMDGYSVLAAAQANPATRTIPFIFLSEHNSPADLRYGMELGADDYLTKPCSTEVMLRAIAKRLEKQAALQASTTSQLDHLRSSIALSLPHELRTPLAGILSNVQLLRALAPDAPKIVAIADTIQASTERLHHLVRNFLLYAELEIAAHDPQRPAQLYRAPLYDADVILCDTARKIAHACDRTADLVVSSHSLPLYFEGQKYQKILSEIIHNAFKFSLPGSQVTVSGQKEDHYFVVSVADYGRGMTPEQIANLGAYVQFERRFYEQQGSGLGLAIAKRLLESSNGVLVIDSEPNHHTTVQALFPTVHQP